MTFDVVVIGAGMAGLAAARMLAEAGLRVVVVEAQHQVGGRILTQRLQVGSREEIVELGAEFIHGQPPELLALIAEAGLTTYERDGIQATVEDGVLSIEHEDSGDDDERFAPLEKLKDFGDQPDCSFLEFLARERVDAEARYGALGYVEGFNAADASQISAASLGRQQIAEDEIQGDRVWKVAEGYDRVPEFLAGQVRAAGGAIRLGAMVTDVVWQAGAVEVRLAGGHVLEARAAVITLPLGVLLAESVRFSPAIVHAMKQARLMRMGEVCRFTLVFEQRFWASVNLRSRVGETGATLEQPAPGNLDALSFLFSLNEMPPVWWTSHPADSASITGWVGGPRAKELIGRSAGELGDLACRTLARLFSLSEEELQKSLVACVTQNWSADAFSRGAYSYVGTGGIDASKHLAEPVSDTLFFAGEHTDTTGHWGTVHGAMRSGLRAAEQVITALQKQGPAHEQTP